MAEPATHTPTVLLVDDNADILQAYAEILRGNGLEPIIATNGESALEQAFRLRPDVIVIDMWMPGMDGFATARALKADERTRETPLIGFTSLGFSGRKAEEAGCEVLLRKTSAPELLVTAVWKLARRATT